MFATPGRAFFTRQGQGGPVNRVCLAVSHCWRLAFRRALWAASIRAACSVHIPCEPFPSGRPCSVRHQAHCTVNVARPAPGGVECFCVQRSIITRFPLCTRARRCVRSLTPGLFLLYKGEHPSHHPSTQPEQVNAADANQLAQSRHIRASSPGKSSNRLLSSGVHSVIWK